MRRLLIFAVLWAVRGEAASNGTTGGIVGTGGDVLDCAAEGFWFADFAATAWTPERREALVEISDWYETEVRLVPLLRAKVPRLGESFSRFMLAFREGRAADTEWLEKKVFHPLPDDGQVAAMQGLPEECRRPGESEFRLNRGVFRYHDKGGRVIYLYNPDVLTTIVADGQQYSFMLMHEWLWEWTTDLQVVRAVNYFLHTREAAEMEPEAFVQRLHQLGLNWD